MGTLSLLLDAVAATHAALGLAHLLLATTWSSSVWPFAPQQVRACAIHTRVVLQLRVPNERVLLC